MFMTELRGGSDLASSETIATQVGDGWVLNGAKWFCSNVDAGVIATLARAEGADPGLRGLSLFLVPATKADGSRNGVQIKRPPRDGHLAFVRSPDQISIELLQKGKPLAPQEPWSSMENIGEW